VSSTHPEAIHCLSSIVMHAVAHACHHTCSSQVSKLKSQKVFSGISGQVIHKMSTFFSLCDAHTAANAR
jgi:hypothetical protein